MKYGLRVPGRLGVDLPVDADEPITNDRLVGVGKMLQSRAIGQGISKPQVQPLSGNKIDSKLPGASAGGEVRNELGPDTLGLHRAS